MTQVQWSSMRAVVKRLGCRLGTIGLVSLAATLVAPVVASAADAPRRPNIVVILADDMGFADMGSFGGEIRTPNLDSLAKDGVRFTNFYTHASCSPTRSMLLSGVDTHLNGLGNMSEWIAPNQRGAVGYEGYLNDRVATLPQLLKDAGYHTYMVGKWHLGKSPELIPRARGFERDFSLLDGGGSYWDMTNITASSPKSVFTEDGRYLTKLPEDYYATKTYTDKLIGYIDANRGDGKPFFAYVAHQAPHDPYHLPRDWRNRHPGEYDKGWDAVRQERLKQQVEMERTIGPTNGFRLRYVFVKDDVMRQSSAGTFMTGSISRFSHCYFLPVTTPVGEPAADAMKPNAEFYQHLKRMRPEGTTVTIWTYPGNYDRLRLLKRSIRELGFQIAVRPLPKGMPLGASRHGSGSLSE